MKYIILNNLATIAITAVAYILTKSEWCFLLLLTICWKPKNKQNEKI